ncbi:MAG: dTMP kinase [Phycisphaeraceae bacterium]|nr:dTMP kinase [Phycisphaeraceae bacterium]
MSHGWLSALAGRFIVFDGPDGSGKSTQLARFVAECERAGVPLCEVREPGGTDIGEKIRSCLLSHSPEEMSPVCEMLLYMASRAHLVVQRIAPALARGELVIADRFVSSTLAYQGTAGGVSPEDILTVARIACGRIAPHLTVIFDVDEDTAAERLNPLLDRMEAKGRAFHARVREGYLEQARRDPHHVALVDASRPPDQVFSSLLDMLRSRLGAR